MNAAPDFPGIIGRVIDLALEVINRPSHISRITAVVDLTTTVDAARSVIADGGNPIRGEVSMLLDVLGYVEAERADSNHYRAGEWCMVGGVLLPMVRQNLALALALRSRRPATTDQDHFRGRGGDADNVGRGRVAPAR